MAATPPLRWNKGLASAPMEASPEHCSGARNMVWRGGKLQSRPGMKPVRFHGETAVDAGVRMVLGDPENVASGTSIAAGTTYSDYVAIGFTTRPVHVSLQVTTAYKFADQASYTAAWTSVDNTAFWLSEGAGSWNKGVGVVDVGEYSADAPSMFMPPLSNATADPGIAQTVDLFIDPTEEWNAVTYNGHTKFWLVLAGCSAFEDHGQTTPAIGGTVTVSTTENRVKCVLPFRDRSGARHLFVAYQYGDDDVEMRYELDGTNLSIGDSLQPDGSAKVFSAAQAVTAHYHRSSDRVIGCIDGFNWFYLIPNEGTIYALVPDDIAADTPYQGLVDGLRSAIPTGAVTAIYDDRLWVANGSTIFWSAPGVFADIWSNGWEINLGDAGGPVTGMAVVAGVLAVLKRNSIYVIQAAGGSDEYTGYQVPGNVGCVAPRAARAADNVAWFPAEDGIYTFNGAELSKVTDAADAFWDKEISPGRVEYALGVISMEKEEYRLFYAPPGESTLCGRRALYASFRETQESCWPQKGERTTLSSEDIEVYGFQATAVEADQTFSRERILLGDRWGMLWEMDRGQRDGPAPVTWDITSARINVGSGSKALARWVTPTVDAAVKQDISIEVWPDDVEAVSRTATSGTEGANAATSYFSGWTTVGANDTVPAVFDVQTLPSQSFAVLGRFFRVRLSGSAAFAMHAVELEFNMQSRRG